MNKQMGYVKYQSQPLQQMAPNNLFTLHNPYNILIQSLTREFHSQIIKDRSEDDILKNKD